MNLQQLILKTMLRLPAPLLRRMSGGKTIEIDGRHMDLATQFLAVQGGKAPSITQMTPEAARQATHDAFAMLNPPRLRGLEVEDGEIPGPQGNIPVRHYRPAGQSGEELPAIVYYHMGGWVIGDLETCDWFCSLLAQRCGAHIMSVDYHLAPEHKFPLAMQEGVAAFDYLASGKHQGVDAGRIGVGGDSAGGGISAVVCQQRKEQGKSQPKVQLLIYPGLDMTAEGGSMESCGEVYPLTTEIMEWFGSHWFNEEKEREMPLASPALAPDVSGLAPALIYTAGFDVLRDQGHAYGEKLQQAGVAVKTHCFDALVHAFTGQAGVLPAARAACEKIADDVAVKL